jgi:hypothetical protein
VRPWVPGSQTSAVGTKLHLSCGTLWLGPVLQAIPDAELGTQQLRPSRLGFQLVSQLTDGDVQILPLRSEADAPDLFERKPSASGVWAPLRARGT